MLETPTLQHHEHQLILIDGMLILWLHVVMVGLIYLLLQKEIYNQMKY